MEVGIDILFTIVSYLPKFVSWWLYSPKRTKENIEVSISAQEGSVEIWCDKAQAKLTLYVQFKNNNPFPIEIDRAEAYGNLNTAYLKAINLFGMRLKKGESDSLHLEGKIDDINLERVNESPDNESIRIELKAIIVNKYHIMRNFRINPRNLMCKLINKRSKQST